MSRKTKNLILFAIMVFIWSTTWAVLKIGLYDTPPSVGLTARFATAAGVLFFYFAIKKIKIPLTKDHVKLYLIVGLFNMALSYFCTYWGTQFIPSSLSSILWSTMPLMIGLQAHFFIPGERLNFYKLISILMATAGVIMILSDQKLIINRNVLIGSLIVLLAVFMGSFPNIYTKRFKHEFNPLVLSAMAMLVATIFHAINATLTQKWQQADWNLISIGSAIYLGIFGSATAFSIFYYLIKQVSLVKVSFLTFITPIVASIIGWLFMNETITLKEIIGCLIILSGIFLFDFQRYMASLKNKLYSNGKKR